MPDAVPVYERALARMRGTLGDGNPVVASHRSNFAAVLAEHGDLDGALAELQQAVAILREKHGDASPRFAAVLVTLGELRLRRDETEAARADIEAALPVLRKLGKHPGLVRPLQIAAALRQREGAVAEAERLLRESLRLALATGGEAHLATHVARRKLGELLLDSGRAVDARPLLAEAASGARRWHADRGRLLGAALASHGRCLNALGQHDAAYAELAAARKAMAASGMPREDKRYLQAMEALIAACEATRRDEEARQIRVELGSR